MTPTDNIREKEIGPSTLLVYTLLRLQSNNRMGVRQVQRAMGYSSPSSAIFQLEKLLDLGLIEKGPDGLYSVASRKDYGYLSHFLILKGQLIPRMLLYSFAVTTLTLSFLGWFLIWGTADVVLALLPSVVASALLWFETIRMWKLRPRFLRDE